MSSPSNQQPRKTQSPALPQASAVGTVPSQDSELSILLSTALSTAALQNKVQQRIERRSTHVPLEIFWPEEDVLLLTWNARSGVGK